MYKITGKGTTIWINNNELVPYEDIYSEIKETLLLSRNQAYSAVNFAMVQAYWQIGRIIVEHEQNGNARAGYRKSVWQELSSTAFAIDLDALTVDGKESRGSRRKSGGEGGSRGTAGPECIFKRLRDMPGPEIHREKTNEISAAQEILQLMDLRGTIVTADAMNCQKGTVSAIVHGKGDYVLALKGNQPLFYGEVKGYFEESVLERLRVKEGCYKKTVEPEHGGCAVREYYITEDTGWYSEKGKWEKLSSFGMVHKRLEKADGTKEEEYRYYICSIGENVDEFERAARGHWGVEVNLHWHLDFTFRDDKNTSMGKTSAKNLQIMKKIVLAILGLVKKSYKISMKRIRYKLSLDYENEVEKMLSMLDIRSIEKALNPEGKSTLK